jgi:hypothetical protein
MDIQDRDIDNFVAVYKSVGIKLKKNRTDTGYYLHLDRYVSEKINGCLLFESRIYFDKSGCFISQCLYE